MHNKDKQEQDRAQTQYSHNDHNDQKREEDNIVVSAWWVSFGTFLSKIVGLFRQVLMAHIFGTDLAMDCFRVAYRIPNILRRVIGEGGLTRVFMPIYSEILEKKGKKAANSYATTLALVLLFVLVLIALLIYFTAPYFIPWIVDGWKDEPAKLNLAIKMVRYISPFILFIGFYALFMGFLNSNREFFLPAVGPAFFNVVWLIGLLVIFIFFKEINQQTKMLIVIGFVVLGSFVQMTIQIPKSRSLGAFERINLKEHKERIIETGRILTPTLFSMAISQINMIVDTKLASRLMEGSVAALAYSSLLIQFPLGLISKAVGTASLPSMADSSAKNEKNRLINITMYSFRMVLSMVVPIAFLAIALRFEIIRLLFQRGNFTADYSTPMTSYALMGYIISVIGYGGVNVLVQAFYAMKEVKIPVILSGVALVVNIVLNILLVDPLIHGGLALASSTASIVFSFLALVILQIKIGGIDFSKLIRLMAGYILISIVASYAASGASILTHKFLTIDITFLNKLIQLIIPSIIGVGIVIGLYRLFGFEEYKWILKPLYFKLKRMIKK